MISLAPICLFTYNRLYETRQTVEALQRNYLASESDLSIFSDGSKNEHDKLKVDALRKYLQTITGFKSVLIIESPENKGLANSIINGVTQTLQHSEKVIVLEDDLVTTANFLNFMNQALDYYQEEQNVQSISGYALMLKDKSNEVYFQTRPGSWGWATWRNRWRTEIFDKERIKAVINSDISLLKQFKQKSGADMPKMLLRSVSNKNDSWYVRWAFDHFRKNTYSVFPAYSYIQNIGFHTEGTHCKGINSYRSELIDDQITNTSFTSFQIPNQAISKEFQNYFTTRHKILVRLKLLKNSEGRKQLLAETKMRVGLKN
jgi:hypothetical protein